MIVVLRYLWAAPATLVGLACAALAMASGASARRVEGTLLCASGQWSEGRHLLESAIATFDLAKDRCDATLVRYLLASFAGPHPADLEDVFLRIMQRH